MKFMSFNTQHCKGYLEGRIDFRVMAEAILATGADVVGLNEMRGEGPHPNYTAQTETLSRLTGLAHAFFAPAILLDAGPYGNGLLSRFPLLQTEVIPIPDPPQRAEGRHYETRCVLKAHLVGGITVLVTHFGLNEDEKQNAVETVVKHLERTRCVLMGDFNLTPDSPLLLPIRERMRDTAERFDAPRLSFPSDRPERKIDYIFVSPDVEIVDADIPAIVASDHRPHTATLTFEE